MNARTITTTPRLSQLQQRCEQQRQQLNQQFADLESRLRITDSIVSTLGGAVKRPELWLAVLSGMWAIKKSMQRYSLWSLLGRGWMMWSVAKRMMKWFKKS